ncbi:MAG: hypothetical protein KU37_08155 [Sulfuricurvum sp. PC08-66]|nr:MAG: hypothetical protein KU37_08155 [Sulfuricurvum sp. PC08-66]
MVFDILIVLALALALYSGYRWGTSKELLQLFKIFAIVTISAMYAVDAGQMMTHIGLLRANDWAVLTLSGFLLIFGLLWTSVTLFTGTKTALRWSQSTPYRLFGAFANGGLALFLLTFLSFMSTQLSFVSLSYKPYLIKHSMLYPTMDRTCRTVVTRSFVDSLIHDPTGSSVRQQFIKTLNKEVSQ